MCPTPPTPMTTDVDPGTSRGSSPLTAVSGDPRVRVRRHVRRLDPGGSLTSDRSSTRT